MGVEELTSELIRFRTEAPAGDEEKCVMFLRDYVQDMRLGDTDFEVHKLSQNRASLIVRIGRGAPPGLLLSGHVDTVAAGDLKLWTVTSPCEPKAVEGKLYGRGAADMKGGLAAMVESLKSLRGSRPRRQITLVATAGEESGCMGLRQLIAEHKLDKSDAIYAVAGEPTEVRVVRRHKGVTRFHIHFSGKSAHSSQPAMGVNAIENASEFISELKAYRARIANESDSELGATVLPVTFAQGGIRGRFNVIPEQCELVIVCRRLPKHSSAYIEEGLQSIIQGLKRQQGGEDIDARIEIQYEVNSLETSKDSPIVAIGEKLTGSDSTFAPFGTEAAYYHDLGMSSIVLGPGSVEQAHTPNEFVRVDQLEQAELIFASMIQKTCV